MAAEPQSSGDRSDPAVALLERRSAGVVDGFAGPGGWSEALRMLGLSDVGIEWDAAACSTRQAAGHLTIRADMAHYPPERFAGFWGSIFSPPCPTFSAAGKGAGLDDLPRLHDFADSVRRSGWSDPTALPWGDPRTPLVLEPLRWVEAIQPEWIACEQVPAVAQLWEHYAAIWAEQGYSTWIGILNAADYGVPQTRKRAILIASRTRRVACPPPTHTSDSHPSLFDPLSPWVTMAEALGWGMSARPANTLVTRANGGGSPEDVMDGGSGARRLHRREMAEGNWVVDRRTNSKDGHGGMVPTVTVGMDRPAPTVTAKTVQQWVFKRPATTIVGSFCPDIVAAPGYRTTTSRQNAEGSVKLTLREALTLQSFRPDYPVQGPKGKQYEQVGNAVPPLLGAHVLAAATGVIYRHEVAA